MDEYLDHILDEIDPRIKIDDEQRKVVLDDSKNALVIAGAGTGKSTTIAAKIKYLVDKKNIDPAKILVMSYSRKSVEDLRNKINIELGIAADVTTFHSLGYRFLRKVYSGKKQCTVVDDYLKQSIFLSFLKNYIYTSSANFKKFYDAFHETTVSTSERSLYGRFIRDNYQNYQNFDTYFDAFVQHKSAEVQDTKLISDQIILDYLNREHPTTIRGEFVKSKAEARIANFLFRNGIDYEYEKIYDEILPDNATYKPDFTLNIGGLTVYLEYFGLTGKSKKYDLERKRKEKHFRDRYQTFIALEPPYNDVILKRELDKLGAKYAPKTDAEIYEQLLRHRPLAEFMGIYNAVFKKTLESIRASSKRKDYKKVIDDHLCMQKLYLEQREVYSLQAEYIKKFYDYYCSCIVKPDKIGFDFDDMILLTTAYLPKAKGNFFEYDYIIVDEYQDISSSRYNFIRALLEKTNAKFLAVGDDWQTIYSFQGSRIEYISDFKKFFGEDSKTFFITNTYRNGPAIANNSGKFVMRNPKQIKKYIRSHRKDPKWSFYIICYDKDSLRHTEPIILEKLIKYIGDKRRNESILVLARRNSTIRNILKSNKNFRYSRESTKIGIKGTSTEFDFMTMHASKGLTADWTFLVGMDNGFPVTEKAEFWIAELFKNPTIDEGIISPEERRLFYVALTRTRNSVIILTDQNPKKRSPFIKELEELTKDGSLTHRLS